MDYIKRNNGGDRIIEKIIEKHTESNQISQPAIDVNALAMAIAQIIKDNPAPAQSYTTNPKEEMFDNTKTLERLANSMTTQRGNNQSNFSNLGNEHHTKTDKDEVSKTIDLLSNIED